MSLRFLPTLSCFEYLLVTLTRRERAVRRQRFAEFDDSETNRRGRAELVRPTPGRDPDPGADRLADAAADDEGGRAGGPANPHT